ncbi:hypothetical protein FXO38_06552 [Capsicum annuum]|nr:hypothetical protein FXO38_06552 [Capsicum annuum]
MGETTPTTERSGVGSESSLFSELTSKLSQLMGSTSTTTSHEALVVPQGQGSQRQVSLQPMINDKNNTPKQKQQEGRGGCTHCENPKHTIETCFQLNETPDWWYELKKKRKKEVGRASLANTGENSKRDESLTLIPQPENTSPASFNNSMAHKNLGDDKEEITKLQWYLATEFEMKSLGGLKYFLGIKVA